MISDSDSNGPASLVPVSCISHFPVTGTEYSQFKRGDVCFGSQVTGFSPCTAGWLQGRNSMVEGHGGRRMLNPWRPGSREQGGLGLGLPSSISTLSFPLYLQKPCSHFSLLFSFLLFPSFPSLTPAPCSIFHLDIFFPLPYSYHPVRSWGVCSCGPTFSTGHKTDTNLLPAGDLTFLLSK